MKKLFSLSVICLFAIASIAQNQKVNVKITQLKTSWFAPNQTVQYVDLGLPSGTLWKAENEIGFFTHDEAIKEYGSSLPTKDQFRELINCCEWTWDDDAYVVKGKNGNTIVFPAAGCRNCDGCVFSEKTNGHYWTSTFYKVDQAYQLYFLKGDVFIYFNDCCDGHSVRLVK